MTWQTGRLSGWMALFVFMTAFTGHDSVGAEDADNGELENRRPLEAPAVNGGVIENDGLDNLVIQRTVTALGDRFYDAFASHWRAQSVVARGVITIEERPWMTEGTEMIVRFQNQVIHRTRVRPRNPGPDETAAASVAIVSDIIARYQRPLGNDRRPPTKLEE